jgi:hypothetical protein
MLVSQELSLPARRFTAFVVGTALLLVRPMVIRSGRPPRRPGRIKF